MSAPTLAFLQNFYTDVTLYVPAEPLSGVADTAAPAVVAPVPASPAGTPSVLPVAAPVAAVAVPPVATPMAVPIATPPVAGPATAAPAIAPSDAYPIPAAVHTTFATQGSNAQGVVILVRLSHEQFLKLPRNIFLNKLLQAIGLVMADVVLVNVEHEKFPVALSNLRREIGATQVIAFGRYLLDITVRNTQIYEPVQFPIQNLAYLAAADIDMVEYDVSLKKRLWAGLQRMFPR